MQGFLESYFGWIPEWFWKLLVPAIFTVIGFFGREAYNVWERSRLPFKQDRERYNCVISNIDFNSLKYLKDPSWSMMPSKPFTDLGAAESYLEKISLPPYLNKKLAKREHLLRTKIKELNDCLSVKVYPHWVRPEYFTVMWESFNGFDDENMKQFLETKRAITKSASEAIDAYVDFRDFGNKVFAEKLDRPRKNSSE